MEFLPFQEYYIEDSALLLDHLHQLELDMNQDDAV
jgi:hypothetical protein